MPFTWKEIALFIASLLMIIIILLQDSKEDADTALTGQKSGLFKNQKVRGFDLVMMYVTLGISIVFVTFSVLAIAL